MFDLLLKLLTSKESECRTGALNIIGSLCNLSYDFSSNKDNLPDLIPFFMKLNHVIP